MRPKLNRDPCWDVLRGFAVLGIVPVNIWVFGWPLGALDQPDLALRSNLFDQLAWHVVALFFEHKMVLVLAFLMGLSLALMEQRQIKVSVINKRLFTLAGLGLAHGYLVWWGDILWFLAIAGGLTWFSRLLPDRYLACVGASCLLIPSGVMTAWLMVAPGSLTSTFEPIPMAQIEQSIRAYRGTVWTQFQQRWPLTLAMQTVGLLTFGLWQVFGAMLLGLAAFRSGALKQGSVCLQPAVYWGLLLLGGLLSGVVVAWQGQGTGAALGYAALLKPIAGALLSAAYIVLFVKFWQPLNQHCKKRLNHTLGTVGRMSLSLYLLQSLGLSLIFYGHGLSLMGQVALWQLLVIALMMMLMLAAVAVVWARHLGEGPAERLWRSISY